MAEIKARSKSELEKNKDNAINTCVLQFMENCIKNPKEGLENLNNLRELFKGGFK